jgi:myb proto-oncogene protein
MGEPLGLFCVLDDAERPPPAAELGAQPAAPVLPPARKMRAMKLRETALWSREDTELLLALTRDSPKPDWAAIAPHFPDKSLDQVIRRWSLVLDPIVAAGRWTAEEDEEILAWVRERGAGGWRQLAARLPGRTPKQVRLRHDHLLDPAERRRGWSPIEDAQLLRLHEKWGNRWAKILESFPGRTYSTIVNRWRTLRGTIPAPATQSEGRRRPRRPVDLFSP